MNTAYDLSEWERETTRGRHVFNYNFHLAGDEFKGWKLLKVVPLQGPGQLEEKVYLWQSQADDSREMVRISIVELPTWRLAQERLHKELGHTMRAGIPRASGKLAATGDISFVGRDPQSDVPAAISFARGNVHVSIASVGDRNVDVSDFAARLDRLLGEPATKADLSRGRVRARSPKTATIEAGTPHILIKNLPATAPHGQWLKVLAPDGELNRDGDALTYASQQPGKKPIATFLTRGE
jgi:hypothetical protein